MGKIRSKGGRNGLAWAGLPLSIRMRFVSKPRYREWVRKRGPRGDGTAWLGRGFRFPFACGLCQNRATGGSDDFLQEDFEVVEMF
jgi:hypothetical protein